MQIIKAIFYMLTIAIGRADQIDQLFSFIEQLD
jgi:hypothetical protein